METKGGNEEMSRDRNSNPNGVVHLIVTNKDGRTAHREIIERNAYSSEASYNRAVRNRYSKLEMEYPRYRYRIELVVSPSKNPISLNSTSILDK